MTTHTNVGREMCLKIRITSDEESRWLWEAHRLISGVNGIYIRTMDNSDVFKERNEAVELLHDLNDGMNDKICDFLEKIGEL